MGIQEAIQLNNHAMSLLENKSFDKAIMRSRDALAMFQQFQHDVEPKEVSLEENSIDRLMMLSAHNPHDDTMMGDFLYDHGIAMPADTMDPTVIIPILIFNCALSHQLLACHTHDDIKSRRLLRRAQGLYQLAHDQLDDQDSRNALFKFALVNNFGVVHKRLGNFEESNRCFEHLVALMMVYIDIGGEEFKRLQAMNGFWKNVFEGGSLPPAA